MALGENQRETTVDSSEPEQRRVEPTPRAGWRLCLVVLGAATLGLAAIGLFDFLRAEGIAARATGAALVVLGGFIVAAIVTAWSTNSSRGRLRGLAAAAALLLVSCWSIGSVLPARQPHLVWVVVVCAVVIGTSLATLLLAWCMRHDKAGGDASGCAQREIGRHELVGAVATMLAALIAVPLAWYSGYYVPVHTAPSVSIKTELGDVTQRGDQGAASLVITVTNTGTTTVRLIGSMYVVSGTKVSASSRASAALDEAKVRAATEQNYGPGARYSATTDFDHPTVIQFGQVTLDQAVLMPDESTEVSIIVFFPSKTYDVLRVGTDVIIARDDRLPTGPVRPTTNADLVGATGNACADRRVLIQVWPLHHGSVVEALTQDNREVVLGRVIQDPYRQDMPWWPAVPYLTYQVQREGLPCEHLFSDDSGGLEAASMAGTAGAMAERLVPAELAPATR